MVAAAGGGFSSSASTRTSAVPAAPGGDTATIDVGEFTLNSTAGTPAKLTPVTPSNPVPVIVTDVCPVAGPVFGESNFTAGALA